MLLESLDEMQHVFPIVQLLDLPKGTHLNQLFLMVKSLFKLSPALWITWGITVTASSSSVRVDTVWSSSSRRMVFIDDVHCLDPRA